MPPCNLLIYNRNLRMILSLALYEGCVHFVFYV